MTMFSSVFYLIGTIFEFIFLGSISGLTGYQFSFLSSFTQSEYQSVFKVCSQHPLEGDTLATMTVLHLLPVNESFRTWVNLLPQKGVCFLSWSNALMHSLSAKRLLLISAPSNHVCLPVSLVSAPHSLPAKSIKDIFPNSLPFGYFRLICKIAWDLDES